MGAVKQKLIEDAEWLEEKLKQVSNTHYEYETCENIICFPSELLITIGQADTDIMAQQLANDLWKVAQLSPEDGNRLMDISEDLYIFAMEEHEG